MNIQVSNGDRSPIITGSNNTTVVGDNNKQKVSNTQKSKTKKIAEYTVIGVVIAILLSFVGSLLANRCTNEASKTPVEVTVDSVNVQK